MLYTNKNINIISLIIAIIIFSIFNFLFFEKNKNPLNKVQEIISTLEEHKDEKKDTQKSVESLGEWYIEIPAINLIAPIEEGTNLEILNTKIGHFTDTNLQNGNIGLAAHNRGYEINYFKDLKKLKMDDKIIYTYKDFKKTYIVDTIEIIESSDWSYLEKTEENKITLITCVENEPKYRRCVQAKELIEN